MSFVRLQSRLTVHSKTYFMVPKISATDLSQHPLTQDTLPAIRATNTLPMLFITFCPPSFSARWVTLRALLNRPLGAWDTRSTLPGWFHEVLYEPNIGRQEECVEEITEWISIFPTGRVVFVFGGESSDWNFDQYDLDILIVSCRNYRTFAINSHLCSVSPRSNGVRTLRKTFQPAADCRLPSPRFSHRILHPGQLAEQHSVFIREAS